MNLKNETYEKETRPMMSHINVGTGEDCTIRHLVETIAEVIGFEGNILFDSSKPDGTQRKLMDVSCLERLGWTYKTNLKKGLKQTYEWFLTQKNSYRS